MTWLQELPLIVRMLPFGLVLLCIAGVFVFLAQRPVDGEMVLAEVASENRAGIAIGFILATVSILPSMIVFALALTITVGVLFAARSEALLSKIELARL